MTIQYTQESIGTFYWVYTDPKPWSLSIRDMAAHPNSKMH